MKPTSDLANPNLPTVPMPGMSPFIRFLAKVEKGTPSVLRYGNRAQAETKRAALAFWIMLENSSSAVVQVGSRFLIAIFPEEYDLDQKTGKLVPNGKEEGIRISAFSPSLRSSSSSSSSSRPPFATISGSRINPRNRHNQNGAGPVYCAQGSRFDKPGPSSKPLMSRLEQYRAVSDRLNGRER